MQSPWGTTGDAPSPFLWTSGPRVATVGVVKEGRFLNIGAASEDERGRLPKILVELPLDSNDERDVEILSSAIKALRKGSR